MVVAKLALASCNALPTPSCYAEDLRAYQRRVTTLRHFRKEMSHSVSRLARHKLPITLTRHARGISRVNRSPAAYDITRSKHRVPFVHSSRPRSTHFDPPIKTMARIAVFAHHDFICSYLILFSRNKTRRSKKSSLRSKPRRNRSTRSRR